MNQKTLESKTYEEMIGLLTAMSIVSRRLAARLLQLEEKESEVKEK
jgi:hypothetical protein